MARRKNAPDLVKVKCGVAERLRDLRTELYGERGGPELARRLGLPVRTWYNYEAGVTVPAEVVLRVIELTSVEATWLLHGTGAQFRTHAPAGAGMPPELTSVESLLRAALIRLERGEIPLRESTPRRRAHPVGRDAFASDTIERADLMLVRVGAEGREPLTPDSGPSFQAARQEWRTAERDQRCLRMSDNSMAPLVAHGAFVSYSDRDAQADDLDGKLVVAWLGDEPPVVRWFQLAGRYALLRTENPEANSPAALVDLADRAAGRRFRVVSWISTPR